MKNGQYTSTEVKVAEIESDKLMIQHLKAENQQMKEKLWVDSNLTKFDDVLRSNYDKSLETFADEVIFHLAKLTNALRGTFFSINLDNQLIEAVAGYSCIVSKLAQKVFVVGEGIIGQAVKRKETIVLDNIPSHNITLQSSMGQLSGNCIVVIPLTFNEQVFGAVELLYLQAIEQKFLDLLGRLSQNIASMLNSIQNNIRTRQLLRDSKALEKELRIQEEELRQNMEELSATQEKMVKKEEELSSNIQAIDQTIGTIEFDTQGNILQANSLFLEIMGYTSDELLGKHHHLFLEEAYALSVESKAFWEDLCKGNMKNGKFKRIANQGKERWLRASYTPVRNNQGMTYKILKFVIDITEEKKLQQDSSNQLAAIDRSSAIIEFDIDGNILQANDIFLEIMGHTSESIQGKHHRIFVNDNLKNSSTYEQFWQKMQAGKFIEGEFKRYTRTGDEVWLKGVYNPILNDQGVPYKVIKFAHDITKQKNLSLDLKNQLNAINQSNAVIEFDPQGRILKANNLFLDLMGYSSKEIIDKNHRIFVDKAQAQSKEYEQFWHQLRSEEHMEGEFERLHKDGHKIWIKGRYSPIADGAGKVYKIIKYIQDITEKKSLELKNSQQLEQVKAAEEELRQNMEKLVTTQEELQKQVKTSKVSNQLLKAILNTAVDVIITMDAYGIVKSANPALTRLFGYQSEEIIGRNIKMLMPPEYASAHDGYLKNYRETGEKKIIGIGRKVEAKHKDGTVFDAHISISEVKLEQQLLFTGFIRKLD